MGCPHRFCKPCLVKHIMRNPRQSRQVPCPWPFKLCPKIILQNEIFVLLGTDYERYDSKVRQLRDGKSRSEVHSPVRRQEVVKTIPKIYVKSKQQCFLPDCYGTFEAGGKLNELVCNVCNVVYCIMCEANHRGKTCQQHRARSQ